MTTEHAITDRPPVRRPEPTTDIIVHLTDDQIDLIRRRTEHPHPAPEGSFRFMRDLELYIELRDTLYNQAAAHIYQQAATR